MISARLKRLCLMALQVSPICWWTFICKKKQKNKTNLLLLLSPLVKIALTFWRWCCHLKIPPLSTVQPTVWAKHLWWHLCPGSPHASAKIVFSAGWTIYCYLRLQKGVQATAIIMSETFGLISTLTVFCNYTRCWRETQVTVPRQKKSMLHIHKNTIKIRRH